MGCTDSMASLGEAYHKGTIVEKNNKKAEEILKKAIELGSIAAKNYYTIEFNDLAGEMEKKCKILAEKLQKFADDAKPKPLIADKKIRPNEKCPCGSGKKYKRCCRN